MKLDHLIASLRNGAVLNFNLADGPSWKLHDSTGTVTISASTVRAAMKRGAIEPCGDTLFPEIAAQTWRWREP